jgi:hypothetical protein
MSFMIRFDQGTVTVEQYHAINQGLEDAGQRNPVGREYHVGYIENDGTLSVVDIWDSMENFEKFGETLIPVLEVVGADAGEPTILSVDNIIVGQ